MTRKKYKRRYMKHSEPYKICKNCKGNGYVRISMYEETQTCKECKGEGHFKNEKANTTEETISTDYVLKLIKILEEYVVRGSNKTIH